MIFRSQPGFEDLLGGELREHGLTTGANGAGWMQARRGELPTPNTEYLTPNGPEAAGGGSWLDGLCFAQSVLLDPVEIAGESVNALAAKIMDWFLASAKTERFEGPWVCRFEAAAGLDGLGRRVDGVEKAFHENLKKRMGRVSRLATDEAPRGVATARGLHVFFVDFQRAFVAREVYFAGQRRMADDELAPSRSYLKIEEAYVVLGREPQPDETVVDLGAAPGGWSYSAAKRGARVIAVDNGPLKGGALDNPLIEHRREDAFNFRVAAGERVDWMFCDLVEEPHHVVSDLIAPWLEGKWCRRFVVILKFGRVDPLALLREVRAAESVFSRCGVNVRVRHLYHDREEFTIVGEVRD